jgi:photosystem II stability/assembly factor-like uncharacterized protein
MKTPLLTFVLVQAICITAALASDNYLILIPNYDAQTQIALSGYPGHYWGSTVDKVFLAGGHKELNWLDNYDITYQAIEFDDETSTLYLCYFDFQSDISTAHDAIVTGPNYVITKYPRPKAQFCRRLNLRAIPTVKEIGPYDLILTYNSRIDSLIQQVSRDTIIAYLTGLSGAAPVNINGGIDTIHTRYSGTEDNRLAAQYLKETLEQYGFQTEYDAFYSGTSRHVASFGSDRAWFVTESSEALRTTDGGSTWILMPDNTPDALWGVANIGPDSVWISGDRGIVKLSSNGGQSFSSLSVPTVAYLFGIDFLNSAIGWVAADSGLVIHTEDSGLSWSRQATGETSRLYDICFADSVSGWAVGRDGVIVHTTDGGLSWNRQTSNTVQRLYGVTFLDTLTGWVVGWGGTLLYTVNGGIDWNSLYIGTDANMYHVDFTDSLHGCVVGWSGEIFRTSDGGANWSGIPSGTPKDFYGLTFADSLIGYAVGDGIVYKTTDGGNSWHNQNAGVVTAWRNVIGTKPGTTQPGQQVIICAHYDNTSEMPNIRAPGADDNGSGATAVVEAARVLASRDYQKTIKFCLWSGEEQGLLGSAAYAAEAAYRGDTIVGVYNFDMIAWDGNGDNSVELHCGTMASSLILGILFDSVVTDYNISLAPDILTWQSTDRSDHASFWDNNYPAMLGIEDFSSDFNPYYHTTGDNMTHIDSLLFTSYVKAVVGAAAALGVIDTTGEAVWDGKEIPRSFMLLRNYPNPFNSATLISFNLPNRTDVDLAIYDLLGRKLITLESGPMEAGSHGITWDAAGCASGVYLCRLRAGRSSEVERMTLIK